MRGRQADVCLRPAISRGWPCAPSLPPAGRPFQDDLDSSLGPDDGSDSEDLEQVGQPTAREHMHDGEGDRSEEYEQDRRKGPSSDNKSKGRARGGRMLGSCQDHEKDAKADRQNSQEIAGDVSHAQQT